MFVIEINQDVAMDAVTCQQNEDDEIWNQQRAVERVSVIQPLKSFIQEMLAQIRANTTWGSPERKPTKNLIGIRDEQEVRPQLLFYRICDGWKHG